MLIIDIVRQLQFVEIDRIVHPVIAYRGTVGMYVNPTFEDMLRICRSRVAPATHIVTPVLILVSAIFVPMIGGRYYLQDNIIILTLLQTAYVYLNGREHASVRDKKRLL